jgi:hypothetical protein
MLGGLCMSLFGAVSSLALTIGLPTPGDEISSFKEKVQGVIGSFIWLFNLCGCIAVWAFDSGTSAPVDVSVIRAFFLSFLQLGSLFSRSEPYATVTATLLTQNLLEVASAKIIYNKIPRSLDGALHVDDRTLPGYWIITVAQLLSLLTLSWKLWGGRERERVRERAVSFEKIGGEGDVVTDVVSI